MVSDTAGNLYIQEYWRIRRVDAKTGILTTVAGIETPLLDPYGNALEDGDGGPAIKAHVLLTSMIMTPDGGLYLGSRTVRRVFLF